MIKRYCINCKHCVTQAQPMLCSLNKVTDLVTGQEYNPTCSFCRDLEKYCGQRAVNYEPIELTFLGDSHEN